MVFYDIKKKHLNFKFNCSADCRGKIKCVDLYSALLHCGMGWVQRVSYLSKPHRQANPKRAHTYCFLSSVRVTRAHHLHPPRITSFFHIPEGDSTGISTGSWRRRRRRGWRRGEWSTIKESEQKLTLEKSKIRTRVARSTVCYRNHFANFLQTVTGSISV